MKKNTNFNNTTITISKNTSKLNNNNSKNSQQQQQMIHLEQQLISYKNRVQVLQQSNNILLEKVSNYEKQFENNKIIEQELNFRREQQRQMQQHMDNYQKINLKLRQKIQYLENRLKIYDSKQSSTKQNKHHMSYSLQLIESGKKNHRASIGQQGVQRQNHPLTPKSRVNINFSSILDTQHGNKKVFI